MTTSKTRTRTASVIGWDIGGAHTKVAQLSSSGRVLQVTQYPCPLWRGIDRLDALLSQLDAAMDLRGCRHALTMTGELADIFRDRRDGVRQLLRHFGKHIAPSAVRVYSLDGSLRSVAWAQRHPEQVASANWHATANWIAHRLDNALLLDIGSTTSDLIPIRRGRVAAAGASDAERLRSGELFYSGVIRTPVMAVVDGVPFAGAWQRVAAEHFATLADVYHLTGDLAGREDQAETADGRGKSAEDCARRLARMLGRDLRAADLDAWWQVAGFIARTHQDRIRQGLELVLSRYPAAAPVPLVGAGVGRFLARRLARQLKFPYMSISDLFAAPPHVQKALAVSAPAVAVARLAIRPAPSSAGSKSC